MLASSGKKVCSIHPKGKRGAKDVFMGIVTTITTTALFIKMITILRILMPSLQRQCGSSKRRSRRRRTLSRGRSSPMSLCAGHHHHPHQHHHDHQHTDRNIDDSGTVFFKLCKPPKPKHHHRLHHHQHHQDPPDHQYDHQDDIALLIAMVMILAAATGTVFFKLYVIDEPPNPNISTFRPLPQQVKL